MVGTELIFEVSRSKSIESPSTFVSEGFLISETRVVSSRQRFNPTALTELNVVQMATVSTGFELAPANVGDSEVAQLVQSWSEEKLNRDRSTGRRRCHLSRDERRIEWAWWRIRPDSEAGAVRCALDADLFDNRLQQSLGPADGESMPVIVQYEPHLAGEVAHGESPTLV